MHWDTLICSAPVLITLMITVELLILSDMQRVCDIIDNYSYAKKRRPATFGLAHSVYGQDGKISPVSTGLSHLVFDMPGLRRLVSIPSEHRFDGLDRESTQAAAVTGPGRQTLPLTIAFAITITVALHVAQFTAVAEPAWRQ